MWKKNRILWYLLFAFVIAAQFFIKDYIFFWDTIQLASKHAHWYYENNFRHLLLPTEFDSGHPPVFGMYLALWWKCLGQSLIVSHLSILPFSLLSVFLLKRLGDFFFRSEKLGVLLPLLLLLDPTFAAQNVLISPDAVLMCAFFAGIFAIVKEKSGLLLIAALVLAMISLRGMMVVLILYFLKIYYYYQFKKQTFQFKLLWRASIFFIPAGLFALVFLAFHYQQMGWIAYHATSPWAASFEKVNAIGLVKNIGIYAWRMLDFGRVFVMLALLLLWLKAKISLNALEQDNRLGFLLVLLIASVLLLSPSLLLHKHLSAHRYFLPIYFASSLLCLFLLFQFLQGSRRYVIYGLICLGLWSGNLWIYPPKIAQGWDATLAHLPYYDLSAEMMQLIAARQIPFSEIGSVFPEVGARKYRNLNRVEDGFERADLDRHNYIFYANIMNDFSDEDLESLEKEWEIAEELKSKGILLRLYRKH
ncbi:MAG: hypothetical protein AAF849_02950 [Bacteroidota bacterium]